jgi:hypothetical protein
VVLRQNVPLTNEMVSITTGRGDPKTSVLQSTTTSWSTTKLSA